MNNTVPESIEFTKKILFIPILEEAVIPMAKFSHITIPERLYEKRYSGGVWVNRDDLLFTYHFSFFNLAKPPFLAKLGVQDPTWDFEIKIYSPISGLILYFREEEATDRNFGQEYIGVKNPTSPILLIPKDEPLPDRLNFYRYDELALTILKNYNLLCIRSQRLKTYAENNSQQQEFDEYRKTLSKRNDSKIREYLIREITKQDQRLIGIVQGMRGKDIQLRSKLIHISREFGESI